MEQEKGIIESNLEKAKEMFARSKLQNLIELHRDALRGVYDMTIEEFISMHRDALRGVYDMTIEEFISMQREMSDIRFELREKNIMPTSNGN